MKQLTNKTKHYIAYLSMILCIVVLYNKYIKNTLELKEHNELLTEKIENSINFNSEITNLKKQNLLISKILGNNNFTIEDVQYKLLNFMSTNFNELKIFQIKNILKTTQQDFTIYTHQFDIEGDFKSILKFIYMFEHKIKFARIVSLKTEKKIDYNTNENQLITSLIIQNYIK
jgi:hypothetical protein